MDNPVMPKVEILENGKPVSQERIDPNVANFIFQSVQTAQAAKMRKLEESKRVVRISSYGWSLTTDTMTFDITNPWISFSLINDGTGNVKMKMNSLEGEISDESTIDSGEEVHFDFVYPYVTKLFLTTESGTATVRVRAAEGRK